MYVCVYDAITSVCTYDVSGTRVYLYLCYVPSRLSLKQGADD